MQAILIYNPNSGITPKHSPEDLQEALTEAGYEPVYQATSTEAELDSILADARGLVVTAGGDGTVRAVATRLINKEAALCILPMGTANNIAKTWGVTGDPLDLIAALKEPCRCFFDLGHARSPWGEDYFVEGLGWGLYGEMLAAYDPNKGRSLLRSIETIIKTLTDYQPEGYTLSLDGKDLSGCYLMVEVLNTSAVGPRLKLSPNADPSDGLFDVVCVHDKVKDQLVTHLYEMLAEKLSESPEVDMNQGRRLEIQWTGFPIHVDGEVRPKPSERPEDQNPAVGARPADPTPEPQQVVIEMLPQAIELWLPHPKEED